MIRNSNGVFRAINQGDDSYVAASLPRCLAASLNDNRNDV